MSQGLVKNGSKQLVGEATHIRGGHIDHAYWRDHHHAWLEPVVDRYSPTTQTMVEYAQQLLKR